MERILARVERSLSDRAKLSWLHWALSKIIKRLNLFLLMRRMFERTGRQETTVGFQSLHEIL